MREEMEKRLAALGEERRAGEAMLADLARRREELQATLWRIAGAEQVLTELLDAAGPDEHGSG